MALNIVDLLPELLEKIFDYLPKANDRRRLSQLCWTFYKVIRRQSKHFGTLYLTNTGPDKSPVEIFMNSSTFPFSKLHVKNGAPDIIQDQDFWQAQEHGQFITELTIDNQFSFHWLTIFPYLKKLNLNRSSKLIFEEDAPKVQLPVEELCIESDLEMDTICYILRCCPLLKCFEFFLDSDRVGDWAKLLPWIESIETVKMTIERGVQLTEILELPSKVEILYLFILPDTNVEIIASFFNIPRTIETLLLDFDLYDNESSSRFTKDKILLLLRAKSIKHLMLFNNIPDFPRSLDLLAHDVPKLEKISISFNHKETKGLTHYWSNPDTASKIHCINFHPQFYPEELSGLNSLSSLTILMCNKSLEVVRNCPKLKTLLIHCFPFDDAQLEPISSLHDLEILELHNAPSITSDFFKTIIKFPKLKKLVIYSEEMRTDAVMLLPENCPNLEELELSYAQYSVDLGLEHLFPDMKLNISLDDAVFEHLIRALPYLKKIQILDNFHSVSKEKMKQMQMEFPYLTINVRNYENFSENYSGNYPESY